MSIVTDWSVYPNFKETELRCRCGCGTNRISKRLMDMLQQARTLAGTPFVINSGCRCTRHNSTVSNSQNSDHISNENNICFGVDIACTNDRARFRILKALFEVGFDRFGWHRGFIHAGISRKLGGRNEEEVIWPY